MRLTQALLPALGVDQLRLGIPGRVVLISSIGGQIGPPFLSAYAASKHGLEGWSKSLRVELVPFGIHVVVVGPGHVATPMWDKAESAGFSAYASTPYREAMIKFGGQMLQDGRRGWPAERVAAVILEALTTARPKARYAPVQKRFVNWTVPRRLPVGVFTRVAARMVGLRRQPDR